MSSTKSQSAPTTRHAVRTRTRALSRRSPGMLPCERRKIPPSPVRLIESGDWGLIPIGIGTNVLYGKNRCELFADVGQSDLMLLRKAQKSFIECVTLLALGL